MNFKGADVSWHARYPAGAWLYQHSLGLALALLFLASFVLHWRFSMSAANAEALRHGGEIQSIASYLADPQLWFESFQNWQSEFLSTAVLVASRHFQVRRPSQGAAFGLGVDGHDTISLPSQRRDIKYVPLPDSHTRNLGALKRLEEGAAFQHADRENACGQKGRMDDIPQENRQRIRPSPYRDRRRG